MTFFLRPTVFLLVSCASGWVAAQTYDDTLSGTSTRFDWTALDGACLTAGTGGGTIPPCIGLPYYEDRNSVLSGGTQGRLGSSTVPPQPDPPGQGALRLTNGEIGTGNTQSGAQRGAVVSNFTFPVQNGLQVIFGTVTYGGNGFGRPQTPFGADGLSFFLMDGKYPPAIGGPGGNLGYRCDESNGADGVPGGLLGIGVDEYGNFAGDGPGTDGKPHPGSVAVLGAGNTTWAALNANWPQFYPDTLTPTQRRVAVATACAKFPGTLSDFSTDPDRGVPTSAKLPYNYFLKGSPAFVGAGVIANQQQSVLPLRSKANALKFRLILSQDGILNLNFRINGGSAIPLLRSFDVRAANGPIPDSLRFGFAASTGAGTNIHEVTCFRADTPRQTAGSGASDTGSTGRVFAGSQAFVGSWDEMNWAGDLKALALNLLPDGHVEPASDATWSASCTLTGGPCKAMASPVPTLDPTPSASRALLTWSGTGGIPLAWDSLPSGLRSALDDPPGTGPSLLAYLRGDRSGEIARGGRYRSRDSVLGDVVHSSPRWVGPPNAGYPEGWTDLLQPSAVAPETPYSAFRDAWASRTSVVYVGANDGLVHGFRAGRGTYDSAGNFKLTDSTLNDGREVLGFAPPRALQTLHAEDTALDFSSAQYAHNLFVDASPGAGDLFYAGAWHTWLVGGLGFGGNPQGIPVGPETPSPGALYVLDVTDPARFSSANAASLVVDSLDAGTLACTNASDCASAFGAQVGTPAIARLHNGQWAVIFGNGLNSRAGTAGLFIGLVDPATGRLQVRFLDTGAGPRTTGGNVTARNGIAEVLAADLDGDRITDFVYAGDAFGNVWRFDLSSPDPAQWGTLKLFSTPGGQPITTQLALSKVAGGTPRVVLAFGTGQAWPQTFLSDVRYAPGQQALYGLWDWHFQDWNARVDARSQLRSLPDAPGATLRTQALSDIQGATTASFGERYETLTRNPVCWYDTPGCPDANRDVGSTILLSNAQQVIYNPVAYAGLLLVNLALPPQVDPLSCEYPVPGGMLLAADMASGGAAATSPFGDGSASIDAIGLGGVGSPIIVNYAGKFTVLTATSTSGMKATPLNLGQAAQPAGGRRLNWINVR